MPWTYEDLKAADALLGIADPVAAAAALNAQTVTSDPVDIRWSQIRDILMDSLDWGALVRTTLVAINGTLPGSGLQTANILNASIAIRECCLYGGVLHSSNQSIWTKVVAAGTLLANANTGAISAGSASAIVALRTPLLPRWDSRIGDNDVLVARARA